jgi:hypothetical protein
MILNAIYSLAGLILLVGALLIGEVLAKIFDWE